MIRVRPAAHSFAILLIVLMVWTTTRAQDEPEIGFDLLSRDDSLVVLVDLSFLLTSGRVSRLKEGLDLGVEIKLNLKRPKRLFGATDITTSGRYVRLNYQLVTKTYRVFPASDSLGEITAEQSLSGLYRFLSDSVFVPMLPLDSLESDESFVLDLVIAAISLNTINIASGEDDPDRARSPLKMLFEQFLDLTGYGREEFRASSRPFSPAEILP